MNTKTKLVALSLPLAATVAINLLSGCATGNAAVAEAAKSGRNAPSLEETKAIAVPSPHPTKVGYCDGVVLGIRPTVLRPPDSAMVFIVDDEESVRKGFSLLLRSVDLPHRAYSSAKQFLAEVDSQEEGCVLLDITMPEMTGLELQKELKRRKSRLRIIAISAHDDADTSAMARHLGANFFLRKPADDQALIDAIHWVMGNEAHKPSAPLL